MKEGQPPTHQPSFEENARVWNKDKEDPVRGPIIHMVEKVLEVATSRGSLNDPLWLEVEALQKSFHTQLGNETWTDEEKQSAARQYRLYHRFIGSSPEGKLFDVVGRNSLAEQVRAIAKKYNISY